jgi:hypothetical protein
LQKLVKINILNRYEVVSRTNGSDKEQNAVVLLRAAF